MILFGAGISVIGLTLNMLGYAIVLVSFRDRARYFNKRNL